jgi:hypothetical protein
VPIVKDKLTLGASWNRVKSDGEGLFSTTANPLADLGASDDYTRDTVDVRLSYRVAKQLELTLGFQHEKLDYNDDRWKNYAYVSSATFLSGAYADTDYDINLGYLKMKYSF